MKNLLVLLITLFPIISKAQESKPTICVEKSTFGIQTGLLGIWGHNESKLSDKFALRTEIGLDGSIFGGGAYYYKFGKDVVFAMTPVFTLEPRYYYNLNKRQLKSKSTKNNSGNFISLKTSYAPDWFVISNVKGLGAVSSISMIPTWGIRRQTGKHFNFETGIGIGYYYVFPENGGTSGNYFEPTANIHLRFGYIF
jgi:hypothetical protein